MAAVEPRGLFVKFYVATVSTVPRARPLTAPRSRSMDRAVEMAAALSQPVPPRHRRSSDELLPDAKKDAGGGGGKRWSLGGLFRRRRKKSDAPDTPPDTSSDDEDARGGFLSRRRSRRDSKHGSTKKKVVGTFDHVVVNPLARPPHPLQQQKTQEEKQQVEQEPWLEQDQESEQQVVEVSPALTPQDVNGNVSPRPGDSLSSRSSGKDCQPSQHHLQVQQHRRQESSGSGSVEGGAGGTTRRGRRDLVKARAEASRLRQTTADSSSDEAPDVQHRPPRSSDDSLSLSKRSRSARTERYIRRLEAGRWQQHHQLESPAASVSPSPAHSPLVRPKLLKPVTPPADAATFPPSGGGARTSAASHLLPPGRAPGVGGSARVLRGPSPVRTSAESLLLAAQHRPAWQLAVQTGSHDNIYGRANSLPQPQQRSQSFDSNIHRASAHGHQLTTQLSAPTAVTGADDVMVVQFPIARPVGLIPTRSSSVGNPHHHHHIIHHQQHQQPHSAFNKQGPPPPPPRDPQRKLPTGPGVQTDPPRPMSYAFESGTDATPHERFRQYFQPAIHGSNLQSLGTVWAGGGSYQRRSGSDNQISYPPSQQQQQRLQSFTPTPTSRTRPNSVTPDGNGNPGMLRPLPSPQNLGHRLIPRTPTEPCPALRHTGPQQSSQQVQYFADQYPRSRRPIHIQYNGTSSSYEQPYLSDSQVVVGQTGKQQLPETRRHPAIVNATDFWRQKEQETTSGRQRKTISSSAKPPLQHSASSSAARSDRSRSNSPHHRERVTPDKTCKLRVPSASFPSRSTESVSSLSGQSDLASPVQPAKIFSNGPLKDSLESPNGTDSSKKKDNSPANNFRPLSMVLENSENQDRSGSNQGKDKAVTKNQLKPTPPAPPQRRFSRQSSTSSIEASEWMGPDDTQDANSQKKRQSTNLEDALSELEAIYNSLRLGDDDLLDRAERRDAAAARQQQLQRQQRCQQHSTEAPPSVSIPASWGRGAESDSGYNYGHDSLLGDSEYRQRRRAPGPRQSGVPDIVADDMAYRRLNPKEQRSSAASSPQDFSSYMQTTPALAGVTDLPPAGGRPDTTLDDVVFRNIRHTNNTLRVADPQPPFGIPLGPVTPAPNSDYLHATPSLETNDSGSYRPVPKGKRVPDVVKDDLAYRNLRKDSHKDAAGLPSNDGKNDNGNFSLKKKRAVRSLSANLMGFVNREALLCVPKSSNDQDFEKAQSLSDLADPGNVTQKSNDGKNAAGTVGTGKIRGAPSPVNKQQSDPSSDSRWTSGSAHRYNQRYNSASWVERAMLEATSTAAGTSTSTETLTDSRVNLDDAAARRRSWQQRLRVFVPGSGGSTDQQLKRTPSPQDVGGRRPSCGKPPPYTPPPPAPEVRQLERGQVDENNLEDLLSALAHEARATSEKLDRELKQLGDGPTNLKLPEPAPLQSPKAVANLAAKESQSTPALSDGYRKSPAGGPSDKDSGKSDRVSAPADRSLLHNILSKHESEERRRDNAPVEAKRPGRGVRVQRAAKSSGSVELRRPTEDKCEIRNLSCDGSVLISAIVRRRQGRRGGGDSGDEDDGACDQLVPDVAGAGASDEEADLEVARATAAAEAGVV